LKILGANAAPGLRGGRKRNESRVNQNLFLTASVTKQLENVGVTCAFGGVNLVPLNGNTNNNSNNANSFSLLSSVSAIESEEASVFCAIMTPHLQTIEQVSWNLVWQVLASGGQMIFHPEKIPTLAVAPNETEIEKLLLEKKRLSPTKNNNNQQKQEQEDADLLNLIRLALGDSSKAKTTTNSWRWS
jgi:hypothetical protein